MRLGQFYALLVLGFLSVAARGDVTDATVNGFSLVQEVTIDASRAEVWSVAIDEVAAVTEAVGWRDCPRQQRGLADPNGSRKMRRAAPASRQGRPSHLELVRVRASE